jgi:hypothetical protein
MGFMVAKIRILPRFVSCRFLVQLNLIYDSQLSGRFSLSMELSYIINRLLYLGGLGEYKLNSMWSFSLLASRKILPMDDDSCLQLRPTRKLVGGSGLYNWESMFCLSTGHFLPKTLWWFTRNHIIFFLALCSPPWNEKSILLYHYQSNI